MARWLWWVPIGVLTLWLALHFFRLGWISANLTETEVIDTYAEKYLHDVLRDGVADGRAKSDCVAYPSADSRIWLVVVCAPNNRRGYEYHVDSLGQFVHGGDRPILPEHVDPLLPAPRL